MNLKNIFKKKSNTVASVKPLNKTQLEKVIGGTEGVGSVPFVGGAISGAADKIGGRTSGSTNDYA